MIPPFSATGVIHPWWDWLQSKPGQVTKATSSGNFSPHKCDLVELVTALGTNPHRRSLISGFIKYRAHLRALKIPDASVQWIDGSFTENKPDPGDIDVITLLFPPYPTPTTPAEIAAINKAFSGPGMKSTFSCDAYGVEVRPHPGSVAALTFWVNLFGHRKANSEWKGILSMPLDAGVAKDSDAEAMILKLGTTP